MDPDLAVITVSYASEDVLPAWFETLGRATNADFVCVVADNAPERGDAVRRVAEAHGAGYLPVAHNPGYGGAINAAVEALPSTVRWIVISNPDVEFSPGAIDRMLEALVAHDDTGAVGPRVLRPDGTTYPSARAVPSLVHGVGHALFGSIWPSNPWSKAYQAGAVDPTVPRTAGWLSGSCLAVRREAFERIGGFDDGFFMYFEDVDLGYRLGVAGFTNVYEPAAVVTHVGAHSTSKHGRRMLEAHHRSTMRFLEKRYHGPVYAPVRGLLRVGLALRLRLLARRPGELSPDGASRTRPRPR
ncbi:glycosyltransferase family 2 protein [Agromyces aerolatus]|uniref:glycosyltransferase family 2 protein n=1 Tax=Agromyces sp. LY-1074 TaxID=3074080 RepID=UPI0028628ECD|nr:MULTISPECIES: glycosyltransferase family 2 protein [unclassified Agromyces]MDR5700374.1 glycosyltransferase family 2 protein [Agromyces sp. LY-1074]MDR5706648.1 glycosyltransferase family 2 protein [Agromyces sp. LY-1358]